MRPPRKRIFAALATAAAALGALVLTLASGDPVPQAVPLPSTAEAAPVPFASQRELGLWTMGALQDAFAGEERDVAWAEQREAEIRAALVERPEGVGSLDALECRASLCRVVVTLGSDPRRELQAITMTAPLDTSGFHGVDPDDPTKIRLFVSREGTVLTQHPHLVAALRARRG